MPSAATASSALETIVMIGAGRIGQALATMLRSQSHLHISLWDTDTAKMPEPAVCNDLVQQSDVVFLCIPSWAMRESLLGMQECFREGAVVVSLVKGLDPESGATMHELMAELLPQSLARAILGGPLLSAELEQGLATRGVAGTDQESFERLRQLFTATPLTLQHSTDAAGVSAVGVLKNVYALGLGIAQALALGDNMRGVLVTQALHEMSLIAPHWQAQAATVYGLAGLGDLVATSLSRHSRNRTVGEELITQGKTSLKSEGLASLALVSGRLGKMKGQLPFFTAVEQCLEGGEPPQKIFLALHQHLT